MSFCVDCKNELNKDEAEFLVHRCSDCEYKLMESIQLERENYQFKPLSKMQKLKINFLLKVNRKWLALLCLSIGWFGNYFFHFIKF